MSNLNIFNLDPSVRVEAQRLAKNAAWSIVCQTSCLANNDEAGFDRFGQMWDTCRHNLRTMGVITTPTSSGVLLRLERTKLVVRVDHESSAGDQFI